MNKREISEVKKIFKKDCCNIESMRTYLVDANKNILLSSSDPFFAYPDEETELYLDIFSKSLSGKPDKNLFNFEFPLKEEEIGGSQHMLWALRESGLKDDELVEEFIKKLIDVYFIEDKVLISLAYVVYDIPGASTSVGSIAESEEVYSFIQCSICPVKKNKPVLSFNYSAERIAAAETSYSVNPPVTAFTFPAFNDRQADIHSILYYTKKEADLHGEVIRELFNLEAPVTAKEQSDNFQAIVKETFGETCEYTFIKAVYDGLLEKQEEHIAEEGFVIEKADIEEIFINAGANEKDMKEFENIYEKYCKDKPIGIENAMNTKLFEVKSPDIVIKVKPDSTEKVSTQRVNGKDCFVIDINSSVEINGIMVKK